jgi:LysM repeat protein
VDTLQAGQNLAVGQSLESSNGYVLTLQSDGNLVLNDGSQVVWAAGTNGSGATSANLQDDGNFVLYSPSGSLAWESGSSGNPGARLVVQSDRNVVVYAAGGNAVWSSGSDTSSPRPEPAPAAAAAPAPVEEAPAAPAAPAEQHWTVDPGDTLWAIAEKVYGDGNQYQRIADANGIANPDLIQPGQDLVIPA